MGSSVSRPGFARRLLLVVGGHAFFSLVAAAQPATGPPASAAPPPAAGGAPPVASQLRGEQPSADGQRLVGRVVLDAPEGVTVQLDRAAPGAAALVLREGAQVTVPRAAVARIDRVPPAAPRWPADPNQGRYLYSPSAFSLGQGHGYVAQREVVLSSVGFGVLDGLDVEAGTVLPTLFSTAPIGVAGVKASAPLASELHAAVGAQTFFLEDLAAGFFFGSATVGTPDAHATLTAGGAMEWSSRDLLAGVATVSGNLRVSEGVALLSENWVVVLDHLEGPWGGPLFIVPSFGVRLFGTRFAVDLALVPLVTGEREIPLAPIPWVSFAWNFPGAEEPGGDSGAD